LAVEFSIYKSSRQFKKHSADLVYLTSRVITGGVIQGDIRMNGYPKEQATFARVSGYVEQFDVHSPQTTVREALLFSAQLRTRGETTEVITAFVDEVMDLVELHSLRDGLVSGPASCACGQTCVFSIHVSLSRCTSQCMFIKGLL
jgi:ABC-type cobalamin/Fe3+-siderophores transport system ATPase subunit